MPNQRYVRARTTHKCQKCMRQIRPGERYHREVSLGDDDHMPQTWKTCEHCATRAGNLMRVPTAPKVTP
jgi:hypothetical protein